MPHADPDIKRAYHRSYMIGPLDVGVSAIATVTTASIANARRLTPPHLRNDAARP